MGIREGWAVGERAGLVKEARLQGKGVGKGEKVVGLKGKVQAQWRRLGCRGRVGGKGKRWWD